MISFAKQLSSKTTTRVHQVGFALLAYVDAHERLPDQPKDLEEFTEKNSTMGRIPRKTISEQLRHYKLENIVRGKQSG